MSVKPSFIKRLSLEEIHSLRQVGAVVSNALSYLEEAYAEIDRLERRYLLIKDETVFLSEEDLTELETLECHATKSPWFVKEDVPNYKVYYRLSDGSGLIEVCDTIHGTEESDAEFIAKLRNSILALLNEIKYHRGIIGDENMPITLPQGEDSDNGDSEDY